MQTRNDFEELKTLYSELQDCVGTNNRDQAKRVYRQLVRAGRPLSEILEQGRNIPTSVKKFERPDPSPQQSLLQQLERDAVDLRDQNSDQPIGLLFEREGSNTTSILPPEKPASSQPQHLRPKYTHSALDFKALHPNRLGSTSARDCTEAILKSPEPPAATEAERYPSQHARSYLATRSCPIIYIALALALAVAMTTGAHFFGMRMTEENNHITCLAQGSLNGPGDSSSPIAISAGSVKATAVGSTSTAASLDLSWANLKPAAVASLTGVGATVSDRPPLIKPDAKLIANDLDLAGSLMRIISAAGDTLAPVIESAATALIAAIPRPEPHGTVSSVSVLLERGDALFAVGDVVSARLFYERAADSGGGEAALRLGETYDPNFLVRAKLRPIQGNLAAAAFWYRRARELGIAGAEILLKGIQAE
jgi:hypothetical protein